MSPEVRVAYRAIVSAILPSSDRADRSAERYAEFVLSPILAAYDRPQGLQFIRNARYSHVLSTDIAAFYQYVDHAILRDELDLIGADIPLVDGLIGLLADTEGKSFGIPQRSEPSDWISELYAARLERWLVRDGFDTWRYSDDFRVGCATYPDALRAIEALARAARDAGLVLNEQKTVAPSFLTYVMNNSDAQVDDASSTIDPSDVEAAVSSDYALEDDDQAVADAADTFNRLWDPEHSARPEEPNSWNVRKLDAEMHRAVRRSLNTLTRHRDASAIPQLLSLLAYQPAFTHRIVTYTESVASEEPGAIAELYDAVISRLSLNEWQRAWVAYGLRACNLPLHDVPSRVRWLEDQLSRQGSSTPAAEAAVTLANADLTDVDHLETGLRHVGPDFEPWYLHAIRLLSDRGRVPIQRVNALRESSPVASAVLGSGRL